jgi:hypothetical protein
MKHLLCLASLCLAPSMAAALPTGETIGTYFDTGATQTSVSVAPFEVFDIYFIAENIPTAIAGYEFYVHMPPELLILSVTAHPVAFNTLDIDSSNEGFIVGIGGACLQGPGPVVLAEFSCMATQPGQGLGITLGPTTPSSFGGLAPGYAECGSLALFPFADAYDGPATVDVIAPGSYCYCDGSGVSSPCGNYGDAGSGCANSFSTSGASLLATGTPSVGASTLVFHGANVPPGQPGLFFQGVNKVNGGAGMIFGDGLRCAGGAVKRLQVRVFDGEGAGSTNVDIAAKGGVVAGDVRYYQLYYRDPGPSPCGTEFNMSNGLEVTWLN